MKYYHLGKIQTRPCIFDDDENLCNAGFAYVKEVCYGKYGIFGDGRYLTILVDALKPFWHGVEKK